LRFLISCRFANIQPTAETTGTVAEGAALFRPSFLWCAKQMVAEQRWDD
jgi:hypothetical protein